MAANGHCFVEWKEQFVSKERGNRVVHYFLKDISGESILAVVGTERSVRHMFYVVSEEFLNVHGADNSVHAGFRWRSRREVVNWLTSMLSKQHRQNDRSKSPKDDHVPGIGVQQTYISEYKGRLARNLKGHTSDIVWSGAAWTCGKQLKHYPAYSRNGITIAIQSFVFVMAEEENRYLAYLEDMYEDRKGQKKVKVRWFHHNREVRGVVSLRNPHPKEVFFTPYAQVISAECVDGPATVLTREHYEKCADVFPRDVLAKIHLCFRQFKSNRVKPFNLSKLRGYVDQPIFSCFGPDFFEDDDYGPGDNVKLGAKRTRSCRGLSKLNYGLLSGGLISHKLVESQPGRIPLFKVNEKIELLCQDSGIRGCWFRCTVLQVSRKQLKVQYDDVKDEDGCGKLEEWIPAFRLAMPDKLGMRYSGRLTIRPAIHHDQMNPSFGVGAPVDAWWSDGWWEGVVTGTDDSGNGSHQVYIPSEHLFLNVERKDLRISRDWVGDQWMDIEANPEIVSAISADISPDAKLSLSSNISKEANIDCSRVPLGENNSGLSNDMDCVNAEKRQSIEDENNDSAGNYVNESCDKRDDQEKTNGNDIDDDDFDDPDNNDAVNVDGGEDKLEREDFETAAQNCETEPMEVAA